MKNKTRKIKTLEHRADFKIKVFGKTRRKLFLNALIGMNEFFGAQVFKKKTKRKIRIESLDEESLLVDFLNEIIYLMQTNMETYDSVKFKQITRKRIEAEIFGHKVSSFDKEVKAATYHGLDIEKTETGFETIVLLDV